MSFRRKGRPAAVGRVSSGRARAALFLVGCLGSAAAEAQNAAPPVVAAPRPEPMGSSGDPQDEIVVNAPLQHSNVATEIPPEVSINARSIQALGAADLNEVFSELAPEIGGGAGKGGQGAPPIVLVNGQRIAGFSAIKDFPPEAIGRIEIFPEEVALQYGYATGQKVVNVVLRSNYKALTLLGRYTLAPQNWRGIYRAKADLIRIGENSHWHLALDYSHEDAIYADDTLIAPGDTNSAVRHTLAAQHDHLTTSGTYNRRFGQVQAELTGSLDLDALQSRPGLSSEDGDLLVQEGLSNLIGGPYNRLDRSVDAQTSLTLNGKLDGWHWSFVGKLGDTTRVTETTPAVAPTGLTTILLPSPTLLGRRCGIGIDVGKTAGCVSTDLRQVSGDLFLNGDLFTLPAGAVTASVRASAAFSELRSESSLAPQSADYDRSEGSAQLNLDAPITARDFALGKLSVGVNGEVQRLSDFGTLSTLGSTLLWSPIKPVSLTASYSWMQQAPGLTQLGEAGLQTPDLRVYDFVTGTTVLAERTEGGNDALVRPTSRIADVRLQVSPLRTADLVLSAEYRRERTRDPIANLSAATAAAEAAFPDRFTRENGYLTAIDVRPVNLVSRDRQQVRMGLTYSTAFGRAWPAKKGADPAAAPVRDQFQIALYDTWHLQDDVVLRRGQAALDLLGTDVIGDGGGTPTHQVELQTTVSTRGWSADVSAVWQTPTDVTAGELAQERLTFSQGVTLNLRLQLNLSGQRWLTKRIPLLRGYLNLSCDNLLGAHTKVHDSDGQVPAAYSQNYLNPTGRTFRITLRKRFH